MPVVGASPVLAAVMDRIGQQIRELEPHTTTETNTAADCRATYRDVVLERLVVVEDDSTSFSAPFFWMLVFWLMVIFLALGLAAPHNRLALVGILLCAVSLSSAIFVITDLSRPYRGLMSISSADMRAALDRMEAPAP